MNIKDLQQQGHSMRQIARLTGHSRTTVERVLHPERRKQPVGKRGRKSKIEPFAEYLRKRFSETGLSGVRLFEEIKQMGYTGAVDAVQRFLQKLDEPRRALERATVRFETPPGEQAQVDWAEIGSYLDEAGERRKVYAFVMILSFSRMLFVKFTTSMKLAELIDCHQAAFEFFGGWTRRILYDNMKQVRLSPGGEWNPLMQDFLAHYGIQPLTCRPYRPRTKGKVERAILYLKDNFVKGSSFADLADLKAKGGHWQTETANRRCHATTGKRPVDLLPDENLVAFSSIVPYRFAAVTERKVDAEGFVRLAGSRYSVPPSVVGRRVIVERGSERVVVRIGQLIVAEHRASTRGGETIANPEHVAQMWQLAMAKTTVPKRDLPLLFQQPVEQRPLAVYEEAAR